MLQWFSVFMFLKIKLRKLMVFFFSAILHTAHFMYCTIFFIWSQKENWYFIKGKTFNLSLIEADFLFKVANRTECIIWFTNFVNEATPIHYVIPVQYLHESLKQQLKGESHDAALHCLIAWSPATNRILLSDVCFQIHCSLNMCWWISGPDVLASLFTGSV